MVGEGAVLDEHAHRGVRARRAARRRGDDDPGPVPVTRVAVYTAPGCHLCGPAVEAVRAVCGDDFELVDITTDPALERAYRQLIPLVKVDGVERFRYEVGEEDLRSVL